MLAVISGTMAATLETGPVCDDTISVAVPGPHRKRGFVLSKIQRSGRDLRTRPKGFGQGGPYRKAGRVTTDTSSTPCPPDACDDVNGGFFVSLVGA